MIPSIEAAAGDDPIRMADGLADRLHPGIVAAAIVGALRTTHIDDAVAALSLTLTDAEAARLEAPCTPRLGHQGVSDPAVPIRSVEAVTGFSSAA